MFSPRNAIALAVVSLLSSTGLVMAESTDVKTPGLSLNPAVVHADAEAAEAAESEQGPLMMGLEKGGAGKPVNDLGLKIYGWIESGYTYNHRNNGTPIAPGPFNHESGNHYMLNQIVLRIERQVDSKKWDVGGMVELMYGTDAGQIHSSGMGFNGTESTDNFDPDDSNSTFDNTHPQYQFDVAQAYIDVNVPVGNGLKVRAGKFIALAGYETVDPTLNAFYSHSYLFSLVPTTQTGILGYYQLNEQWGLVAGISRGWDQTLEDNNGAIDALGQITYTPNKQVTFNLNWIVGPENDQDTSHYRTLINPIATWQVTEAFKVGVEGLYVYDGGLQGDASAGVTHAYGDTWGAAVYAGYTLNEYMTLNLRGEKAHIYADSSSFTESGNSLGNINLYEVTLGLTIVPMPKDPLGKNLIIRPEVRYDWSEDAVYSAGGNEYKDQLTFGADIIIKF